MPYQINYESNGIGVLISFSGVVKGDEIFSLNEHLMSDDASLRWRYQIWDFSGTKWVEVTTDQLRTFALQDSRMSAKNPNQKIAIIPPLHYQKSGLDRVFHIFEEVWTTFKSKTFLDVDTAREWASGGHE